MLQKLLNLGLVEIGSNDSRFEKIEAAGAALMAHLRGDPALIIPAALIAIDYDADEEEPVFNLVEEHVIQQWNTMRNTHVNRPRELLRSTIIHVLSLLAEGNPKMAALIWHTVVSPLNHGQARLGKEAELVREFMGELGKRAEEGAAAFAPPLALTSKKGTARKNADRKSKLALKSYTPLKDNELITQVGRSAGPQYPTGKPLGNSPNQYWPNQGQPWAMEFTPRITAALVKAINLGMHRIFEHVKGALDDQTKSLKMLRDDVLTEQQAGQVRLDVLWWSDAKYSPSLARSYRELQGEVAAVAMAYDLSCIVPAMAPASVAYVLGESAGAIEQTDSEPEKRSVERLLDTVRASGSALRELVPASTTSNGRMPFVELVAAAISGENITSDDLRGKAGIDPALELSIPEFAMWTFRDIQARRLVETVK